MRDCRLQLARIEDAAALAQMSRELIETGLAPSWTAARIARHIEHPESIVLIARLASENAGFAVMQYAEDRAHLNLLAVTARHRRRGIARQLLGWLEETARTAGTFLITLELRARSADAHAFYSALGYEEAGRAPGYYQGIEDAIRMMRDLCANRGVIRAPKS